MSELSTMSLDEVKEQADILEITYTAKISRDSLIKKIEASLSGEVKDKEPVKTVVSGSDKKKKVWIVIAENENDKQPAYVRVNGRPFRIKRGMPVEVPEYILYTLRMAKRSTMDAETRQWRQIETYPFYITEKPAVA